MSVYRFGFVITNPQTGQPLLHVGGQIEVVQMEPPPATVQPKPPIGFETDKKAA